MERNDKNYVLPHTALKLRDIGYPQGKTPYLWHLKKGAKVSLPEHGIVAGEEHWELYKRNKHDMSSDADAKGLNRWVAAPTIGETKVWAETEKGDQAVRRAINKFFFMLLVQSLADMLDANPADDDPRRIDPNA